MIIFLILSHIHIYLCPIFLNSLVILSLYLYLIFSIQSYYYSIKFASILLQISFLYYLINFMVKPTLNFVTISIIFQVVGLQS